MSQHVFRVPSCSTLRLGIVQCVGVMHACHTLSFRSSSFSAPRIRLNVSFMIATCGDSRCTAHVHEFDMGMHRRGVFIGDAWRSVCAFSVVCSGFVCGCVFVCIE